MELDKDHKFNFFKKPEKSNRGSNVTFGLGFITATICGIFVFYLNAPKVEKAGSHVLLPKGAVIAGVLTAQNSFVSTAAPTFVIHPQNDSLGLEPQSKTFESLSQKEKLTYWANNQEPGVQLTPDEVQKIVKIMQTPTK